MNKSKTRMIVAIVIFQVIIFLFSFCYATISITKEDFVQKFEEVAFGKVRSDIKDTQIQLASWVNRDELCTIDYKLGEHPTFSVNIKLNDKMSFDEYTKETAKYVYLAYGLMALKPYVEKDMGEYIALYYGSAVNPLFNSSGTRDNFNCKQALLELKENTKDKIVNDDAFILKTETIKDTSSEFEVKAILEVKINGNSTSINTNENSNVKNNLTEQAQTEEILSKSNMIYVLIGICIILLLIFAFNMFRKRK